MISQENNFGRESSALLPLSLDFMPSNPSPPTLHFPPFLWALHCFISFLPGSFVGDSVTGSGVWVSERSSAEICLFLCQENKKTRKQTNKQNQKLVCKWILALCSSSTKIFQVGSCHETPNLTQTFLSVYPPPQLNKLPSMPTQDPIKTSLSA